VRVSDALIFRSAMQSADRSRDAEQTASQVASSGLRVSTPGDDPAASGLIVAYGISQQRYTAIGAGAQAASNELAAADSSLSDVATQLSRARTLAVQFANSGYTSSQMAMGGSEVDSIVGQIVSDLNTRFGNRYVFGGTKDDAPPFDTSGNFTGNDDVRQVELAPGVLQQANVQAGTAFKGLAGGTDVLGTLQALSTALKSGDATAVKATLDGLDASTNQVAAARSQCGVSMSAFDASATASKTASTQYRTASGALSDADIVDSSVQLQATQTALEATLSAVAQTFKLSLVNYL
jgi:flagellar hook-associated protein 3 FlgL